MTIVIIDYNSGNVHSAQKALEKAGAAQVVLTDNPDIISRASHIVLPGVGAFGACATALHGKAGVIDALEQAVMVNKTPFLGICVGMQLLAKTGHENGTHKGLGWLDTEVQAIKPTDPELKIPHMGWNSVDHNNHTLFKGITNQSDVYFVHSYAMTQSKYTIAKTSYGGDIVAAVAKENIMGVQFHPEKSQQIGMALLSNFLGTST